MTMSLRQPSSTDGKGNRWKCHYDSSRKFKSEWQKKYPWIEQATDGSGDAFCSLYRMNITPRLSKVARHEAKHVTLCKVYKESKFCFTKFENNVVCAKGE